MLQQDPWFGLKSRTSARIALGRAGGSLPTGACLAFAADHADARDAVYSRLDLIKLQTSLPSAAIALHSQASDRATYLKRPDLGRRLDAQSKHTLQARAAEAADVALIVADGLSATAAQEHAGAVVTPLINLLQSRHFSIAPLCIVEQARVAIQDEIGLLLNATIAVILIGERPGLGTSDSLGAYLVHTPAIGKTDADRNCISNIHPRHLPPIQAAEALFWLIEQARSKGFSGVMLKDDRWLGSDAPDTNHA